MTGQAKLGNTGVGIDIPDAVGTLIGGTSAVLRNVVSGNGDPNINPNNGTPTSSNGINLRGAHDTTIQNNYIGISADVTKALGNVRRGIYIEASCGNTTIGGASGFGNYIAANGRFGIDVNSNSKTVITFNTFGRLYDNVMGAWIKTADSENGSAGIHVNKLNIPTLPDRGRTISDNEGQITIDHTNG